MNPEIIGGLLFIADIETVYALMAIIPAILVIILVVLGLDHDFDVDVDADIDIDVDVDADITGGPGFISFRLFLGFVTGFGLLGFLTVHFDWQIHHLISGALGGIGFYFVLYKILKVLYDMQANSQIAGNSLIGYNAVVTSKIMRGGTGEIKATDPKTAKSIHLRAKATSENFEINKGCVVLIKSVVNGLAIVENPLDNAHTFENILISENSDDKDESLADAVSKIKNTEILNTEIEQKEK